MKRNRGAKKIGGAYAWDAITVTPLITDLVNCKYLPSTMYGKDVNYFLRNNSERSSSVCAPASEASS